LAIASEFKAKGPLTRTIFAITGFDDAISIVIFSFASTLAVALYSKSIGYESGDISILHRLVFEPLSEIGLAVIFGLVLGYLYRLLTRKVEDSHILLLWVLGMMFVAEGISTVLDYSVILCNMVMGTVIINLISSAQEAKLRRALESLLPLVFGLFFVFAGAQLDIRVLPSIGWGGLAYIICRTLGKWLGASTGAMMGRLSADIRKYSWAGLLSQVGVGLGLAMLLIDKFRPLGMEGVAQQILAIVTATSIVFEVAAPILTKWALLKTGEIRLETERKNDDD
ncbi:MAG: cation:proton antiporter, partial [Spirochaetota bacterium]